jgi:very-short-patch-repair endonuclease
VRRTEMRFAATRMRQNQYGIYSKLWDRISYKQLGPRFYRQHVMCRYILDFYCPKAKLAIELDGPYHSTPEGMTKDQERDAWLLQKFQIATVRFGLEMPLDVMVAQIRLELEKRMKVAAMKRFAWECLDGCGAKGEISELKEVLFALLSLNHVPLPGLVRFTCQGCWATQDSGPAEGLPPSVRAQRDYDWQNKHNHEATA